MSSRLAPALAVLVLVLGCDDRTPAAPETGAPVAAASVVQTVSQTRAARSQAAITRLRGVLGAEATPSAGPNERAPLRSVIKASVSKAGHVDGLWAFRPDGLAVRRSNESFEATLHRFLRSHGDLYGLELGDAGFERQRRDLGAAKMRSITMKSGVKLTTLSYFPTVDGIPVLNQNVVATFVGDKLASINGTLARPPRPTRAPGVGAALAQAAAMQAMAAPGGGDDPTATAKLSVTMEGELVYLVELAGTAKRPPQAVLVDARDGRVRSKRAKVAHAPPYRQPATYNVGVPWQDTLFGLSEQHRTDKFVWVDSNGQVFPWHGADQHTTNTTQSYVFSTAIKDASNRNSTFVQHSPQFNYTATFASGPDKYYAQTISYWAQRIAARADAESFQYLSGTDHQYLPFNVLMGEHNEPCQVDVATVQGCYRYDRPCPNLAPLASEPAVDTRCIHTAPRPGLNVIFHEIGHHLDYKLRGGGLDEVGRTTDDGDGVCTLGTDEEAEWVLEEIAEIFMTLTLQLELPELAFTSYTGGRCDTNIPGTGCLQGIAITGGTHPVHLAGNNDSLRCPPRNDCQFNVPGGALYQAIWESSHDLNCFHSPCYDMQGNTTAQAEYSGLFWALYNLPKWPRQTHLVGNFLNYYYWILGQNVWNDRWWLYNHHGLTGPNYGYSKCHQ